jgi:glucose/arabinose dehydrogenase
MKRFISLLPILYFAVFVVPTCGNNSSDSSASQTASPKAGADEPTEMQQIKVSDITLSLPKGFTVTEFSPAVGHARHLAVNGNGDVYIKLSDPNKGQSIIRLRDTNGDGIADQTSGFGNYGGTGIAIKNGYLYASSNADVYRYKLNANNEVSDPANPEKIISGLANSNGFQHNTKSLALDDAGNIYVTIGAPSNACQQLDRTKGSPGMDPCPILEKAGGIWQFKADKPNQTQDQGIRYATGIRNCVGLDWNKQANQLFAMQHGRDQLHDMAPDIYDAKQSAELPAEEMLLVKKGANFGWPYCYYDQIQGKKLLNPEYGGDGKKQDRCAGVDQPVMAFPGHWAPNALIFYTGKQFPEHYRNGAFVAFHGSWNRAPELQGGYNIAFAPFKNGKPSGKYEVFANGFAGVDEVKGPGQAKHRPMGLAMGPDGSLYISDDVKGTIWKIAYKGK